MAFCKLFTMKTPITAADLLNDKVLPFFEAQEVPLLRILTDQELNFVEKLNSTTTNFFGNQRYRPHKNKSPPFLQTNGIVERFHRTILNEFYQVAFRKKIYENLDDLQNDLDIYLKFNFDGTHQGKMCCGKTP